MFRNSTDHQKILDDASGKHKMVIDKLNEERAMLEVCYNAGNLYKMWNNLTNYYIMIFELDVGMQNKLCKFMDYKQ